MRRFPLTNNNSITVKYLNRFFNPVSNLEWSMLWFTALVAQGESKGDRHMRTMVGNHSKVQELDSGRMDRKIREQGVFEGLGLWMVGSVSLLFLFSAGLEFFVRETFRQLSIATVLLALSLASWSFVLGLGFLFVFLVWWFVKWRHGRVNLQIMSGSSSAGSHSQAARNIPIERPAMATMGNGSL